MSYRERYTWVREKIRGPGNRLDSNLTLLALCPLMSINLSSLGRDKNALRETLDRQIDGKKTFAVLRTFVIRTRTDR